ncbi:Crp/Fnr family transcriptional regulator [Sphingomonas lutea]|uniref:Crp/Fnr family transcriptional regulator n=1 Tax=Sphingomonas lutea TaxID=1045317 RepID=A0A7G9SK73_9SPHN|nr:Crp/Fnr family transcriptional regulator [Sphingomonas lutea]QNN68248.1 Crp/Fnr family transcriptional regulator [Sphingomonas lutea]
MDSHFRKLRRRHDVSAAEEAAFCDMVAEHRRVGPDEVVIRAGEPLHESTLLLDGWLARVKDLRSGSRQFTGLHVPGDFADLHSFTLGRLDHEVVSLTECRLAIVPHARLKDLMERNPRLARILWSETNLDAAINREWTVSMARRSALARVAHLLCELSIRLEVAGLSDGMTFDFPMTQNELADCLGLTTVHVNRTIQELRKRGLIQLDRRQVTMRDVAALRNIAEFDDSYLYLGKAPL